jgi:hypothetical protein
LPDVLISGHLELMNWLCEYANLTDDVHVKSDHTQVIDILEQAGYGHKINILAIEKDPNQGVITSDIVAKYTTGEAVFWMRDKGLLPPAMIKKAVSTYIKLKQSEDFKKQDLKNKLNALKKKYSCPMPRRRLLVAKRNAPKN